VKITEDTRRKTITIYIRILFTIFITTQTKAPHSKERKQILIKEKYQSGEDAWSPEKSSGDKREIHMELRHFC
jgi:hypothetical protein